MPLPHWSSKSQRAPGGRRCVSSPARAVCLGTVAQAATTRARIDMQNTVFMGIPFLVTELGSSLGGPARRPSQEELRLRVGELGLSLGRHRALRDLVGERLPL